MAGKRAHSVGGPLRGKSGLSNHGYIKLYRSLFKHEFFRPGKFSEREAFTWIIAEAAWKPRSRRVGQFFVDLDRGVVGPQREEQRDQVPHCYRPIAPARTVQPTTMARAIT